MQALKGSRPASVARRAAGVTPVGAAAARRWIAHDLRTRWAADRRSAGIARMGRRRRAHGLMWMTS